MMGHGEPNEELISQYQGQIRECFDYYENVLARHEYLVGQVSKVLTQIQGFLTS
jgi:glutathione S-transferase